MLPVIRNNNSALAPTSGSPAHRLSTLFDRFFNDPFFSPLLTAPAWSALPVSVWEDEENVHVEIDAPGVTDKDIDLAVHEGTLVVRGERKAAEREGGYDTRSYGRFEQRVTLPTPVSADEVEAKLVNGVLSVTFPKSEDAKPRKIAIRSE